MEEFIVNNFTAIFIIVIIVLLILFIILWRKGFLKKYKYLLVDAMKEVETYSQENEIAGVEKMTMAVKIARNSLLNILDAVQKKHKWSKFLLVLAKTGLTDAYIQKICQKLFDTMQDIIEDSINKLEKKE